MGFKQLFCSHDFPFAWKELGEYYAIDFENIIFTRFVKECTKCGEKKYYIGPYRFKSDGRKVY